jgi:hypothetical protein
MKGIKTQFILNPKQNKHAYAEAGCKPGYGDHGIKLIF